MSAQVPVPQLVQPERLMVLTQFHGVGRIAIPVGQQDGGEFLSPRSRIVVKLD